MPEPEPVAPTVVVVVVAVVVNKTVTDMAVYIEIIIPTVLLCCAV